jgi:hypothetical protein
MLVQMQLFGYVLLWVACIREPGAESYIRSYGSVLSQNAEFVMIRISLSCFKEARLLLLQYCCPVIVFQARKPEDSLKERFWKSYGTAWTTLFKPPLAGTASSHRCQFFYNSLQQVTTVLEQSASSSGPGRSSQPVEQLPTNWSGQRLFDQPTINLSQLFTKPVEQSA